MNRKRFAYLLAAALMMNGLPLQFNSSYIIQAEEIKTVWEENFNGYGKDAVAFKEGSGLATDKIVASPSGGGVWFNGQGQMRVLNTSKINPSIDIKPELTTGQAIKVSFDWGKYKNSATDTAPRTSQLEMAYAEDGVTFTTLDKKLEAVNSTADGSLNNYSELISGISVNEDLVIRITAMDKPGDLGKGNRPGFLIDNMKVEVANSQEEEKPEIDTQAPVMQSLSPDQAAIGVETSTVVKAVFDEPIQIVNESGIKLYKSEDNTLVSKNGSTSDKTLSLTPTQNLENNTEYTVSIETGSIQDLSGNAIKEAISWQFTTQEATETLSIAEALKRTNGTLQVEGVVVAVDGANYYIQDQTAGIMARSTAAKNVKVGTKVRAKGSYILFKGLNELENSQITVLSSNEPLPEVKKVTISDITDSVQSQRVSLEGVTLGTINKTGNTVLTDDEGHAINLYKGGELLAEFSPGDRINLTAVVSKYNSLQLIGISGITKDSSTDILPPVIVHTAVTNADIYNDIQISATITDNRKVAAAKLYYKKKTDPSYKTVDMVVDETKAYIGKIPKADLAVEGMQYYIEAIDASGNRGNYPVDKENPLEIKISTEDVKAPEILSVFPTDGQVVRNKLRPQIGANYKDDSGIDLTKVKLLVDDQEVTADSQISENKINYIPKADLTFGEHKVKLILVDKSAKVQTGTKEWKFTVSDEKFGVYFGQIHAHTNISDGEGKIEEAYDYAKNKAEQLDFIAITDHSNSFDHDASASLADGSMSEEWKAGHAAADMYNENGVFTALYGYEMTWSKSTGGYGHMNTYNTPGFETRSHTSMDLKTYYETLKTQPQGISQFNHPGTTFGDFVNFAYYDKAIDPFVTLLEVGNGEGTVGSSGYFPSYAYYDKALAKGWHVAPTNNQDNHKGKWGDANTARTVALASSLTRDGIYDALRERRVYATEDNNLEINYEVNGEVMGSSITAGDTMHVDISVKDQDAEDRIKTLSIIADNGVVAKKLEDIGTSSYEESLELPTQYSYYYLKVEEADGDLAVTAPVWVGEALNAGIESVVASDGEIGLGEEAKITTQLYNNSSSVATDVQVSYYLDSTDQLIGTSKLGSIVASSKLSDQLAYKLQKLGRHTILVKVAMTINGTVHQFSEEVAVNVVDTATKALVVFDGSHSNAYVYGGSYPDNMKVFTEVLKENNGFARINKQAITEETLKGVSVLVLTDPDNKMTYTTEELEAIRGFVNKGGSILITSKADYEEGPLEATNHSAAQANSVLHAIDSSIRFNDDEMVDNVTNGGQPYRLYLSQYNTAHGLMKDVDPTLGFSHYSGSTFGVINQNHLVEPLVYAHTTTESLDSDSDGAMNAPIEAGKVMALAAETLPSGGKVIVCGSTFISDFETKLDSTGKDAYSNRQILKNLIKAFVKAPEVTVTPINALHLDVNKDNVPDLKGDGREYVIEGTITAASTAGAPNNAFFDVIYVQDQTGGITVFGVSTSAFKLGQKVRITGRVDSYQGDTELEVSDEKHIKIIDENIQLVEPTVLSAALAMAEEKEGLLVKVTGKITDIKGQNIFIQDTTGKARVYIEGYIGSSLKGKDNWKPRYKIGDKVSAVGLASEDPEGHRLRVRDTEEIILLKNDSSSSSDSSSSNNSNTSKGSEVTKSIVDKVKALESGKKEAIKEALKSQMPYTALEGVLSIEQINQLTKGSFTKEELKQILASPEAMKELGINNLNAVKLTKNETKAFKDVKENHWAYDSIQKLAKLGIVVGVSEETFMPKQHVKVTDALTFFDRVLLINHVTDMKLSRDIVEKYLTDSSAWYFPSVASIGSKLSETTLKEIAKLGEGELSRGLMAQVLYEMTNGSFKRIYPDKEMMDIKESPYQEAINYCVQVGLLSGTSEKQMSPEKPLTRAELMVVLERLNSKYEEINQ